MPRYRVPLFQTHEVYVCGSVTVEAPAGSTAEALFKLAYTEANRRRWNGEPLDGEYTAESEEWSDYMPDPDVDIQEVHDSK